jgi:DNA polymerase elongation subunit (family B)
MKNLIIFVLSFLLYASTIHATVVPVAVKNAFQKKFPNAKKVKWGLAKDDVTPKDIFRMTNEGAASRAIIAKYCIQDCNLVHYLFNKVDVVTDLVEMSKLCSVPMSFLIFRGQGIKLTSYVAKKCREKGVLMPCINKGSEDDGYEGAIVLDPKCGLYLDDPVCVGDFASLYPSSMLSENLCPSSKVWTKIYDLAGNLVSETGDKDNDSNYIYDNLPQYEYVDVRFDTYRYVRKNPKASAEKIKSGYKLCRFAQPITNSNGQEEKAIMPSILQELLKARKDTRKLIPQTPDEFMKNVLDKRQLAYKVTANSLYGQLGAKTSTFYEPDIAASTTATGRLLLTFAKKVVEECYADTNIDTKYGVVNTKAEYVYGDTDSVFFKFNLTDKSKIAGRLELYSDKQQTIIRTSTPNGYQTIGTSINYDYQISSKFLWRAELKRYNSKDPIFKYTQNSNQQTTATMVLIVKL